MTQKLLRSEQSYDHVQRMWFAVLAQTLYLIETVLGGVQTLVPKGLYNIRLYAGLQCSLSW
jgi:hypothetical protein